MMKASVDHERRSDNRAAVIIGGGLRKMPQMIPILEEIINTTKVRHGKYPRSLRWN